LSDGTQFVDRGQPNIVVVGGGITGLSAAHRLRELDPQLNVQVLEAAKRPGGVLRTVHSEGFLIEESADSFLTALPHGLDLCRRVGLGEEVIPTDPTHRRAFVVSRGRLVPIPDGLLIMAPTRLWPMVTTPILGPWGKLRMGLELLVKPGDGHDESLGAFARRRFGREAYERLIQPLVGGMYTGDPERLSVQATMPRFQEMEQRHGSLIRGSLRERARQGKTAPGSAGSGARYGLFVGLQRGMASLIDVLARRLPEGTVHCGVSVDRLERNGHSRWLIHTTGPLNQRVIQADGVILATPVQTAGRLLASIDPDLARRLGQISSTSCAIVSLGYRREEVAHALDGFGFVVPKVENRQILSGSFSSVKFPGRGPKGTALIRTFLGGAFRPEILDRDNEELARLAADELGGLLGVTGTPLIRRVSRWPGVMPQYELGHTELVREIESAIASHRGLALAGNAYHGVGVPQCIQSGEQAAEHVAMALAQGLPRVVENQLGA
jgi:oxygen-dependent protoporphyrinogen oxidase